jgi:uncharacterized protein DUF4352
VGNRGRSGLAAQGGRGDRLRRIARLAAAGVLLSLLASGCTLISKQKSTPPPPNTDTTPDQGGIGTPITLRGTVTELEVRVTRVLDPAPASPGDQTLSPRDRFVGIELALRNIGKGNYSESPLSDSKLLLADGSEADPVNLLGGPCGGRFALHVTLRPGAKADGCVPFEARQGRRPSRFQFALESGFAPEVGTWRLR